MFYLGRLLGALFFYISVAYVFFVETRFVCVVVLATKANLSLLNCNVFFRKNHLKVLVISTINKLRVLEAS